MNMQGTQNMMKLIMFTIMAIIFLFQINVAQAYQTEGDLRQELSILEKDLRLFQTVVSNRDLVILQSRVIDLRMVERTPSM